MKRARQFLRRIGRPLLWEQLLYRRPMAVAEIRAFSLCHGAPAYPVCPRCEKTPAGYGFKLQRRYNI